MKVRVHMLAFGKPGEIREVALGDGWVKGKSVSAVLNLVFQYGQNEFQRQPHPSVSVGDVIELPEDGYHVVRGVGFQHISNSQFEEYKKVERRERQFHFAD